MRTLALPCHAHSPSAFWHCMHAAAVLTPSSIWNRCTLKRHAAITFFTGWLPMRTVPPLPPKNRAPLPPRRCVPPFFGGLAFFFGAGFFLLGPAFSFLVAAAAAWICGCAGCAGRAVHGPAASRCPLRKALLCPSAALAMPACSVSDRRRSSYIRNGRLSFRQEQAVWHSLSVGLPQLIWTYHLCVNRRDRGQRVW